MNKKERILKNIFSNWAGFAVNALVMLGLTPFVLSTLGVERYGVWILINSVIGYYGMLDFGFRAGVNQFLIRSLAAEDYDQANVVFSSALAALAALGALVALLTVIAIFFVPELLNIPAPSRLEAVYCILIVGMAAAIQIVFSPFAAIFVAKQRFDLLNLIAISMRLTSAALIVVCLYNGIGLIGLAAATAASTIGGCLLRAVVARRLLPSLRFSRHLINTAKLRGIGSFGLWNFLISMTDYVYLNLLPILIVVFMPVAAVGHYALAAGLWHQLNKLFSPIGQVLYPVAAELHVKNDVAALRRLYVDGTRLLLLVVLPVVLIAMVWADDFYRLWVGGEYLSGEPFVAVSTLLRIMLIGTVFGYTANIAGQSLIGAGNVKSVAMLKALGSVTAVLISVALVEQLGLLAVVIALTVAILVSDIIGMSKVLEQQSRLRFGEFLQASIVRLTLTGLSILVLNMVIHELWEPDTWTKLLAHGCIAGICALLVVLFIGMKSEERHDLVLRPLAKVLPWN